MYKPTPEVLEWFNEEGFVLANDSPFCDWYEKCYSGSMGYGFVTVRFFPHDYGWEVIVGDVHIDKIAAIGMCQTLEHMKDTWKFLLGLGFDSHYNKETSRIELPKRPVNIRLTD
jgi:hypothetical protein